MSSTPPGNAWEYALPQAAREAADQAPDLDVRVLRPGESTEIEPAH